MHDLDLDRFTDDVVIVTGSTRGIGAGIARRFAREGASVVVSGRTDAEGTTVAEELFEDGGEACFVECDVRDPDAIRALVDATTERYGAPSILVNNAAVQTETDVTDTDLETWERVVGTNLRGYWLCAKTVAAGMDDGAIVNVSSNHAHQTIPRHFPYNVTKAGIDGLTRALALDLAPLIRVNAVNPGWVAVDRTVGDMDDEARADLESLHPVGRIGAPADVAGAVAFLASADAAFVTGASVVVDGGRSVVLQDDTLPDYRARSYGDSE